MAVETLKKGSAFRKARLFSSGFMISISDDTPDGRARFREIVEQAQTELRAQGYSVEPYISTHFSGWDMVIIRPRGSVIPLATLITMADVR